MNEEPISSCYLLIVLKYCVSHEDQTPRNWASVLFLPSSSSLLIDLCFPYPRRCLRHPKPSKMRPISSSSGATMAVCNTSNQLPIPSCILPQREKNWCTWQGARPLSLTFSFDCGVYLLVKCWQSVCTMYMKESNPALLVTLWACAEPL